MKKLISFVLLLLMAPVAHADESAAQSLAQEMSQLRVAVQDLKAVVDQQSRVIQAQGMKIERLEGAASVAVQGPAAAVPAISGRWNPEIGAVADIAGTCTNSKDNGEGEDRLSVRELEIVLGAAVDPYSRLDATVSFSDFEEASLEEAYLTRFDLPLGFTARVGRVKPKVGKVLPNHRDSLETVDEPLVIRRWFGVEGINKTGVDATAILDLPFDSSHEVTLGVLEGGNGEEGTLFGDRRRPTFYGHLKNYWELGDASGLELGFSQMIGDKDGDSSSEVSLTGADLTWKNRFSENTELKLQGEALYQNRRNSQYEVVDDTTGDISFNDLDGTLWGGYALADLRFHPQWSAGFRWDYAEPVDNAVINPSRADIGYAGYLTFYQSEFARWRAQVSWLDGVDGKDDLQLMLQGTFAIGEHKHKIN